MQMLGKPIAEALTERARTTTAALAQRGVVPKLTIVRCGEKPSDIVYENNAKRRAEMCGVAVEVRALPENIEKTALLETIRALNADKDVHGVLLLRPLPKRLTPFSDAIRNALDPAKDVDGMTDSALADVTLGRSDAGFAPCTAQACMEILAHYGVEPRGRRAVVIGRSAVIGKPAAMLLLQRDATVTICHTKTQNLAAIVREADIVICAAGVRGLVTRDCVRAGQVIIDVSMNWDAEKPNAKGGLGAFAGDCDFEAAAPIVDKITPVPGGVGAATTAVLVSHVVEAALRAQNMRQKKDDLM